LIKLKSERERISVGAYEEEGLDREGESVLGKIAKMCWGKIAPPWEEEVQQDDGMGELLVVLGYQGADTIHYNPSNLSTWLQSMLFEFNPRPLD
jgi:hypothetical protein